MKIDIHSYIVTYTEHVCQWLVKWHNCQAEVKGLGNQHDFCFHVYAVHSDRHSHHLPVRMLCVHIHPDRNLAKSFNLTNSCNNISYYPPGNDIQRSTTSPKKNCCGWRKTPRIKNLTINVLSNALIYKDHDVNSCHDWAKTTSRWDLSENLETFVRSGELNRYRVSILAAALTQGRNAM